LQTCGRQIAAARVMKTQGKQEKQLQANKLRYDEVTFLERQVPYDALNILTCSILN
jgi:hypothetical protein